MVILNNKITNNIKRKPNKLYDMSVQTYYILYNLEQFNLWPCALLEHKNF